MEDVVKSTQPATASPAVAMVQNGAQGCISPGGVGGRGGLSDAQLRAIEMIVAGVDDTEIGRRLGVHRNTVGRWKKTDSQFLDALDDLRAEMRGRIFDKYNTALGLATDAMIEALKDSEQPLMKLRAAQTIICMSGSMRSQG